MKKIMLLCLLSCHIAMGGNFANSYRKLFEKAKKDGEKALTINEKEQLIDALGQMHFFYFILDNKDNEDKKLKKEIEEYIAMLKNS